MRRSTTVPIVWLTVWLGAGGLSSLSAQSREKDAAPSAPAARADGAPPAAPAPRRFPRPGNFFVPPSGAGHYSLVDQLRDRSTPGAPRSGYPASAIMAPAFYDADFRYLDGTSADERRPFERLKRLRFGDGFLFSTGGTAWYRLHHERNSRLTSVDQTFSLGNLRVYGDLWYRDRVRVFGEFVTAGRSGGTLTALPIDSNQADLLNAFAEVKVADLDRHPVYVRAGRQEVLLGSQRLLSPLPWANMRRNFDGVRVFREGERVDVDVFWLEPVVPDRTGFDAPSHDVQLAGTWFTYRPRAGHSFDAYYLFSNDSRSAIQQGITIAPSRFSTVGSRYAGDRNGLLWDVEGALQIGRRGNDEALAAAMATIGVGRHLKGAPWNPTIWAYYDHATGDGEPAQGRFTTFNQLFPFGHYYLGWADIAGRQNLRDANAHLSLYPMPWITIWLQYHHLWLDRGGDALYNAGGAAIRRDPTGGAGTNVGDDLDVVLNFHIDAQSDVLLAYAHQAGGRFLETTAGPTTVWSSRSLFLIYNFRW
jgi:hypothetical protein